MADFSPEHLGSFGSSLLSLGSRLVESGNEMTLVLPRRKWWAEAFELEGCRVEIVPPGGYPFGPREIYRIDRILAKHRINLVHTHFGASHLWMASILKMLRYPDISIIAHWRGGPARPNRLKALLGGAWYRFLDRHAVSAHVANSILIKEHLSKLGIAGRDRLLCIHNGIDTNRFEPGAAAGMRGDLSIRSSETVILHPRNFRKAVDFDLIVGTQRLVAERTERSICFIYVGEGEERERIENLARGIRNCRTMFLGTRLDIERIYATADITLASWEPWCGESVNNSVYESLAMGVPLVGASTGALPRLFGPEHGVLAVDPVPEAYSEAVEAMLDNLPEWRARALESGRSRILRFFSIERWADTCFRLYQSLREARSRKPSMTSVTPSELGD